MKTNTINLTTAAAESVPSAAELLDAIQRRAINSATRALMDGRVALSVPYDVLDDSACDWCRRRLGVQVIGNSDSVSIEHGAPRTALNASPVVLLTVVAAQS